MQKERRFLSLTEALRACDLRQPNNCVNPKTIFTESSNDGRPSLIDITRPLLCNGLAKSAQGCTAQGAGAIQKSPKMVYAMDPEDRTKQKMVAAFQGFVWKCALHYKDLVKRTRRRRSVSVVTRHDILNGFMGREK